MALKDTKVSFDRIGQSERWSAEMAVTAVRERSLLNGPCEAARYLKFARTRHPGYAPSHTATAMRRFDQKEGAAAIEVLQPGLDEAGDSGELNDFLGLTYFWEGDIDTAKRHAESARALGYLLTGVAREIARLEQSTVTAAE